MLLLSCLHLLYLLDLFFLTVIKLMRHIWRNSLRTIVSASRVQTNCNNFLFLRLLQSQRFLRSFFMVTIETTFSIIHCIGNYYYYIDNSESCPRSVYYLLWSVISMIIPFPLLTGFRRFKKGLYCLERRGSTSWWRSGTKLTPMDFGQWFELARGSSCQFADLVQMSWTISVLSLLPHGNSRISFLCLFPFFLRQITN